MCWLFDYFLRFVNIFLFYFFFEKQSSKDRLSQGNLLKRTLLNKKQSNLEKEMYENIYLYSPHYIHLGQEVIFTKHTFTS